jgi:hypothetical protein
MLIRIVVAIAHHVTRDMIATIMAGTTAMAPPVGVVAIAATLAAAVTADAVAMARAVAMAVMVPMDGPVVDGPALFVEIVVGPDAGQDDARRGQFRLVAVSAGDRVRAGARRSGEAP